MAKTLRTSLAFLIFILLIFRPEQAEAYYDDMHYHFTYYLARSVGYTPEQAYRIASASVSIDWDSDTEPVQQPGQLAMWNAAVASYGVDPTGSNWANIRESVVSVVSVPRIKFHAMMDCLNWPLCHSDPTHQANALAVIPVERERVWQAGLQSGNLGAFLHFLEDEPSHFGYPSDNGHWFAVDMWWNNRLLRMGTGTDYIDYDGNDGKRDTGSMINEVLTKMSDFMKIKIPKQKPRTPRANFTKSFIRNVYRSLRNANPISHGLGFQEAAQLHAATGRDNPIEMYKRSFPILGAVYSGLKFRDLWKTGSEPKNEPAYNVITHALEHELKSLKTHYFFNHFQYELDNEGNPVGQQMIDKWVLYGDLHLNFRFFKDGKMDFANRPIEVTIRSVPTFKGEKSYVLAKETGQGAMEIKDLPIGEVEIEVRIFGQLRRQATAMLEQKVTSMDFGIDLGNENFQLELDDHLERMRLLMGQLKNDQQAYKKTDAETKALIDELQDVISRIRETSSDSALRTDIKEQARRLAEDAKQQSVWAADIEKELRTVETSTAKVQDKRDAVCSSGDGPEAVNERNRTQTLSAGEAAVAELEKILADSGRSFDRVRDTYAAYKDFHDRWSNFDKSKPDDISGSLEELYKKAEEKSNRMADFLSSIDSARKEIEYIYEFASRMIDREIDIIRDNKGKNRTDNEISITISVYEGLRTPFINIYRELSDISVEREHRAEYKDALAKIAEEWDTIQDELEEYRVVFDGLKVADFNAALFQKAESDSVSSFNQLQNIRQLLGESRQCLWEIKEKQVSADAGITLPDVIGMPYEKAAALIQGAGLAVLPPELGSPAPAPEKAMTVERVVPEHDGPLKLNDGITLFLFTEPEEKGEQDATEKASEKESVKEKDEPAPVEEVVSGYGTDEVMLPDVVGMAYADAVKAIEAAGLVALEPEIGKNALRPDDVGKVELAVPAVDGQMHRGDGVTLYLYGEAVAAGTVPNVLGMDSGKASDIITEAGFFPAFELGEKTSDPKKEFTIARQAPGPGVEAAAGSDIHLIVFTLAQSSAALPDLSGMTIAKAQKTLQDIGMSISVELGNAATRQKDINLIYKQSPEPGMDAADGSSVTVWVYGEANQNIEPSPAGQGGLPQVTVEGDSTGTRLVLEKVIYSKYQAPEDLCKADQNCRHTSRVASGLLLDHYFFNDNGKAVYRFKETYQSTGDVLSDYNVEFFYNIPPSEIHAGDTLILNISGTARGDTKGWHIGRRFTYYIKQHFGNNYFDKTDVYFNIRDLPKDGQRYRGSLSKQTVTRIPVPKRVKDTLVIGGRNGQDPALYVDWVYRVAPDNQGTGGPKPAAGKNTSSCDQYSARLNSYMTEQQKIYSRMMSDPGNSGSYACDLLKANREIIELAKEARANGCKVDGNLEAASKQLISTYQQMCK